MHTSKLHYNQLITLKNRSDFVSIAKDGKKWVSRGFILQVMPNTGNQKRVGYTVSKRVDKSAVRRNRIKRRLRSIAADILPEEARGGYDYVLIGRPDGRLRNYESLRRDLLWCLKKLDCRNLKKDENAQ